MKKQKKNKRQQKEQRKVLGGKGKAKWYFSCGWRCSVVRVSA